MSSGEIDLVENKLNNITQEMASANSRINALRKGVDDLKKSAEMLKANATDIQDRDVEGM